MVKTSRHVFPLIRDGTKRIPGENEHWQSSCFSSRWEVSSDFFKRSGTSGKFLLRKVWLVLHAWPVKYQLYIGPAAAKWCTWKSVSGHPCMTPLGSNVRWKLGGPETTICSFRAADTSDHVCLNRIIAEFCSHSHSANIDANTWRTITLFT